MDAPARGVHASELLASLSPGYERENPAAVAKRRADLLAASAAYDAEFSAQMSRWDAEADPPQGSAQPPKRRRARQLEISEAQEDVAFELGAHKFWLERSCLGSREFDLGADLAKGISAVVKIACKKGGHCGYVAKLTPLNVNIPNSAYDPLKPEEFDAKNYRKGFVSTAVWEREVVVLGRMAEAGLAPRVYSSWVCRASSSAYAHKQFDVGFIVMERADGDLRDFQGVRADPTTTTLNRGFVTSLAKLMTETLARLGFVHNEISEGNVLWKQLETISTTWSRRYRFYLSGYTAMRDLNRFPSPTAELRAGVELRELLVSQVPQPYPLVAEVPAVPGASASANTPHCAHCKTNRAALRAEHGEKIYPFCTAACSHAFCAKNGCAEAK